MDQETQSSGCVRFSEHPSWRVYRAVTVLDDSNMNGKMDFDLIGLPTKGYGFSNDAKATSSPPPFSAASFSYSGKGSLTVTINIVAPRAIKPHRIERYMASDDPDFETKAADIIGLYVKPPQHAAVFCVDEKTAIQALDRLDPVLPLSPGRLERHGFEYYRHGTLSLYAALNTRNGEVMGKTAARHTSQEFVAFLAELVANQPRGKEIHLIADNLSAHKTKRVEQFLAAHPKVHLHYTPTYSSWLNQVENWFARIEREVIARGVFTSVKDLARKLMRYIRHYNRAPKPIKWTYRDPSQRISLDTISPVTGHYYSYRFRPQCARGDPCTRVACYDCLANRSYAPVHFQHRGRYHCVAGCGDRFRLHKGLHKYLLGG